MKSLLIIATAVAMSALSYANTEAKAAPAAQPVKMAKVSKEARVKCKNEHKQDHKGFVECLKAASVTQ